MRRATGIALCVWAAACSDDGVQPDPAVAPFVGDWTARSLVLTNKADTTVAPDLIQMGATFLLNVQPSGLYTAQLTFLNLPDTEIGQLSVAGSVLTLTPSFPRERPPTSGIFEFQGDDLLIVDGDTEFDFNFDLEDEEALVHFELVRDTTETSSGAVSPR